MIQERYIAHVDMDAFFASIEQRDNPSLKNKPVVIGADPEGGKGRGVVSTCSYEARKYGIHSAMPISQAYRCCPNAIFLPVNMEKYSNVSEQLYEIFYSFTPDIESISIDEAFLDISGSYHLFGTPLETCKLIKEKIKVQTQLTASVGLAPTKMVAKIASDLKKPDGLVEVKKENLLSFLQPLEVDKICGLGKKTKSVLEKIGIKTIGELAVMQKIDLVNLFGKNGLYFWELANGIDERAVESEGDVKSISNETTFRKDTSNDREIESELLRLCEKVSMRLRADNFKGRTITLKIRTEGFHTYTRATSLKQTTNFADVIYDEIQKLYKNCAINKKIRLVGVKISNLVSGDFKDNLFEEQNEEKMESLHVAVDKIRDKFGDNAIHRAGTNQEKYQERNK